MTEALARRMPTTIVGSAAGRITADSCCGGARIVRADVIRSGSTCFTAAIVLSRSDQAQLYIYIYQIVILRARECPETG